MINGLKKEKNGALIVCFTERREYQLKSSLEKNNSRMSQRFANTPFRDNYLSSTFEWITVVANFAMLVKSKSL